MPFVDPLCVNGIFVKSVITNFQICAKVKAATIQSIYNVHYLLTLEHF